MLKTKKKPLKSGADRSDSLERRSRHSDVVIARNRFLRADR
jgi:hypothetical protein